MIVFEIGLFFAFVAYMIWDLRQTDRTIRAREAEEARAAAATPGPEAPAPTREPAGDSPATRESP